MVEKGPGGINRPQLQWWVSGTTELLTHTYQSTSWTMVLQEEGVAGKPRY